jgi:hypothetical protein
MVKVKEKRTEKGRNNKPTAQKILPQDRREQSPEASQEDYWNEAVQNLQEMRFSTLDEAINAVIDKVVERVGGADASNPDLRQFLFDLLDTDPGIKEQLESVLQVGR